MEDVINYLRKVRRGTMFIIEGPSGTGKGTVIKEILARDPHIKFSVSVTTRPRAKARSTAWTTTLSATRNMTG